MIQPKTILLPTDFSPCAEQALGYALFLTTSYGATLHVLHVVEIPALSLPYVREDYYVEEKKKVLDAMSRLLEKQSAQGIQVEQAVMPGPAATSPASIILDYADEYSVDLIVIGTHGRRGLKRLVMGNVAEEVIRGAVCPVLAVREHGALRPRRILVPLDFSANSEQVLGYAQELAKRYKAQLMLLHVIDVHPLPGIYGLVADVSPEWMQEAEDRAHVRLERIAQTMEAGVATEFYISHGYPPSQILDAVEAYGIDLIVLASHGWSGHPRFVLGGVVEKVMRAAPCPVFIMSMLNGAVPGGEGRAGREQVQAEPPPMPLGIHYCGKC